MLNSAQRQNEASGDMLRVVTAYLVDELRDIVHCDRTSAPQVLHTPETQIFHTFLVEQDVQTVLGVVLLEFRISDDFGGHSDKTEAKEGMS